MEKKKKEGKKEGKKLEKIKIGYQDVVIERETSTFSKQTDSYGEYDHRKNIISIQTELSDLDEANTLLHEILHGIAYINSLTVGGMPLDKEEKEEIEEMVAFFDAYPLDCFFFFSCKENMRFSKKG